MTDSADPWEMSRDPSGERRRDDPAGDGGVGDYRPEKPPGGAEAPGDGDTEWVERGLPPAGANDTLVEEVGATAPAAFAYTYEADPLAEYWETPGAQVVLPDEPGPHAQGGPAGVVPGRASAEPPGQGQNRTPLHWSNRRIFAAFGITLIVVAATSLSFGLMWGRAGSDVQAQAQQADGAGASDRTRPPGGRKQPAPIVAQARRVDRLLSGSTNARDEVVTAVVQTRKCKHIARSVRDLRAAAKKREQLVARVRRLDVGAIPRGQQAASALRRAWNASARADRAFAAWALDVGAPQGCSGGTPVTGPDYRRALRASAAASGAKARFVRLWNPVAARTGLPHRSEKEI